MKRTDQKYACTTTYPLWRAALVAAGNPYGTSGGDPLFPDMRCVVPAGKDTSRGLLTGSTVLGALLGAQTVTLAQGNMPNYTLPNTFGVSDTRTWATANTVANTGGGSTLGSLGIGTQLASAAVTVSASGGSLSFSGGVTSGGSGTPASIVQPTLILNFIGRAA